MKKLVNKVYKFIFPFASVWLIVIYFRNLSQLNLQNTINGLLLLFIPVIFFESLSDSLIVGEKPIRLWPKSRKRRILLSGKIFFWFVLYIFWVVGLPGIDNPDKYVALAVVNVMTVPILMHAYRAESYLTIIAFIIWMVLYYFITVKRRRFKILISLIIPVIMTYGLYRHFYYSGGIGASSQATISAQKGVEIFYSKEDFPKIDYLHYKNWTEVNSIFPRDIYVDIKQNAIYANYGNTFHKTVSQKIPILLRIDLKTKETKYFLGRFTRAMSAHTSTILISPYHENKIYELDKKDLSVIRTFPAQVNIYPWEVMDIYHDSKRNYIYVSNEINPGLFKYDYKTGKLLNSLYLEKIKYGGAIWYIKESNITGMIYVISYMAGQDVVEIDPERFDIRRTLNLNISGLLSLTSCALLFDDEKGVFYLQHGGMNKLYEIDTETFKVKRILEGEVHARRTLMDKKRDVMYINSFYYGKLIALDLKSGKQIWSVKVGGKPYGLALNNDTLYVNSRAGIIKIDLETVWKENSP